MFWFFIFIIKNDLYKILFKYKYSTNIFYNMIDLIAWNNKKNVFQKIINKNKLDL